MTDRTDPLAEDVTPTLLLVDDDPIVREAVTRRLRTVGFAVEATGCAQEALEWVTQRRFDGIVADFHMPSVDGPKLLERLLLAHPDVPCVILSGDTDVRASLIPSNCSFAVKGGNFDQLCETLLGPSVAPPSVQLR